MIKVSSALHATAGCGKHASCRRLPVATTVVITQCTRKKLWRSRSVKVTINKWLQEDWAALYKMLQRVVLRNSRNDASHIARMRVEKSHSLVGSHVRTQLLRFNRFIASNFFTILSSLWNAQTIRHPYLKSKYTYHQLGKNQ